MFRLKTLLKGLFLYISIAAKKFMINGKFIDIF